MADHSSVMTRKGQVTVPAELRKALGISVGDRIAFRIEDGKLVLETAEAAVRRLTGSLRDYAIHPPPTAEELRSRAEEAWVEDALERLSG